MVADGSEPTGAAARRGPLREGDRVQLTDPRGRMHTVTLREGGQLHTHRGVVEHADLLGGPEGRVVTSTSGVEYLALRPLLADHVLSMPRGAAVVYPKDAGQVVAMADVYPGARVVEAGAGSGALTMSLLRAVGDAGAVHSFERRAEFAAIARGNVETLFGGPHPAWTLTVGDLVTELPGAHPPGSVDRVVLDMLAPWECLAVAATALAPGGVLLAYVATTTQLSRLAEAVRAGGRWTEPAAWESLVRGWHLEGLAVRPQHRMVGHTGFLLTTRRLADGTAPPQRRRRPAKGAAGTLGTPGADVGTDVGADFSKDVGTDVGTDEAAEHAGDRATDPAAGPATDPGPGDAEPAEGLGERTPSAKKLRRAVRDATRAAEAAATSPRGTDPPPASP